MLTSITQCDNDGDISIKCAFQQTMLLWIKRLIAMHYQILQWRTKEREKKHTSQDTRRAFQRNSLGFIGFDSSRSRLQTVRLYRSLVCKRASNVTTITHQNQPYRYGCLWFAFSMQNYTVSVSVHWLNLVQFAVDSEWRMYIISRTILTIDLTHSKNSTQLICERRLFVCWDFACMHARARDQTFRRDWTASWNEQTRQQASYRF